MKVVKRDANNGQKITDDEIEDGAVTDTRSGRDEPRRRRDGQATDARS